MTHLQPNPLLRHGKKRPSAHFCSGNNMTEERRDELEHEPSLFEERESDEEN